MRLLIAVSLATREQRSKWAYNRVVPEVLNSLALALADRPAHASISVGREDLKAATD